MSVYQETKHTPHLQSFSHQAVNKGPGGSNQTSKHQTSQNSFGGIVCLETGFRVDRDPRRTARQFTAQQVPSCRACVLGLIYVKVNHPPLSHCKV